MLPSPPEAGAVGEGQLRFKESLDIYLSVLDRVWEDRCAHLGTLVR